MDIFNYERMRRGLSILGEDVVLQAEAQRRANQMAAAGKISIRVRILRRGRGRRRFGLTTQHLPGRRHGIYEGVGMHGGRDIEGNDFIACGTNNRRYNIAGAASTVRGNTTYYCLIYDRRVRRR